MEIFLIFMFFGMIMWKNDLGTVDTDKLSTFTDDFEVRLCAWKQFLPSYFALNKTNYARYGSY